MTQTEIVAHADISNALPENWSLARLGDVCTVHPGQHILEADYNRDGDGVGYLTGPADFGDMYPSVTKWTHSPKAWGEPGDVLVTVKGAGVGKANLAPHVRTAISRQLMAVRPAPALVSQLFIYYQIVHGLSTLQSRALGSTVPGLSREDIASLPILHPSLAEQHRIVAVLTTWEHAIGLTTQLIAAKQERKRGLMQQLLTGKRRLPAFRGSNWTKRKLGDLFTDRREANRGDLSLLSITSKDGVVPRDSIERRDTSNEDKSLYLRICPGDIGYNTMRMWQGVSAVSALEGIVSPAYTVCVPHEGVDASFMGYLFKFPPVIHLFKRHSQGLVDDTLSLKFDAFSVIEVTVPAMEEQCAIAQVLAVCDRELALLDQKLALLKQQKQSLMQRLLTGRVRVPA